MSKSITTQHEFPELKLKNEDGRQWVIRLATSKGRGTVETRASVNQFKVAGEGLLASITHRMFTDYSQVIASTPCKRVTEKALKTQHAESMKRLDTIRIHALEHYADELRKEQEAEEAQA